MIGITNVQKDSWYYNIFLVLQLEIQKLVKFYQNFTKSLLWGTRSAQKWSALSVSLRNRPPVIRGRMWQEKIMFACYWDILRWSLVKFYPNFTKISPISGKTFAGVNNGPTLFWWFVPGIRAKSGTSTWNSSLPNKAFRRTQGDDFALMRLVHNW